MNDALLLLCFLAQMPILWSFVSMFFTFIHAWEEVSGEGGPLWENFGCIVGVLLPGWLGFLLFTVLLPLGLMTLALCGYWHGSLIAISLLLGARLGDTLFSHWGLCASGLSRPNPGIWSTTYYVIEAAVILSCFKVSLPWTLAGGRFLPDRSPGTLARWESHSFLATRMRETQMNMIDMLVVGGCFFLAGLMYMNERV